MYPNGVRELADGGTWNTLAGQPTDDSEMALMLARMLADHGTYNPDSALKAYLFWLDSGPFDCGHTVSAGLRGRPNLLSQANGALMRISPLGIFGANYDRSKVSGWARQDAALTHPHPVCLETNSLFAAAIAHVVRTGCQAQDLYLQIKSWAADVNADERIRTAIANAAVAPPADYLHLQGWVLIAFHNALWQLLHAPSAEDGIIDTIMRGGDTDTNAAICGALLGSVHGREAIPKRWVDVLLGCRPATGLKNVRHPRPECFWPVDVLDLAGRLIDRSAHPGGLG